MKLQDIFGWIISRPQQSSFMTHQQGKDLIVLYYQKFSDEQIDITIGKTITKKITDLARRRALKSEKFKKIIDKRAKAMFNQWVKDTNA